MRLDLRRNGRPLNVTLVAQESGADQVVQRFDFGMPQGGREFDYLRVPGGDGNFVFSGSALASIELVQVNAGLADYFGTSDGLLVVNVGNDSTLGLRNGDVILSIGGRKPGSPAHAMRILGTYDPSETVTFDVMRMKRRITVTGKMPERRRGAWTISPNSFDFGPMSEDSAPAETWQELPRMLLKLPFLAPASRGPEVRAET